MFKECANCGKLNNIANIYCIGCKKILRGKKILPEKQVKVVVPSRPEIVVKEVKKKDKYFLLCPLCGNKEYVEENGFVLMCSICGYFFEEGIDVPVKETDEKDNVVETKTEEIKEIVHENKKRNPLRKGPLREVKNADNTLLRIFVKKTSNIINIDTHGDYIGGHSAYIWRTSKNGWYIRADEEGIMLNNDIMNRGVERQLKDGSTIMIDYELYKVEIYE